MEPVIELKPGFWSLNKTTHASWLMNMKMPISVNDVIESRLLPSLRKLNEPVTSRSTAISFRTRSPATIAVTAVESENEATPIGKNQAGRFWGSFPSRDKLNSATKLNDVAAAHLGLILLLLAEQGDLPNEAKAKVEGRSIINIWRPHITQQW